MSDIIEAFPTFEDRQAGVGQDVRLILTVNGAKANVTDTTNVGLTITYAPGATTVTAGTITSITTGEYASFIQGTSASEVGRLDCTWNVTDTGGNTHVFTSEVAVTGPPLYTLYELRQFGPGKMTSSKFSDEKVTRIRHAVTHMFEEYANVSFVKRYSEFTLDGNGSAELEIPVSKIISAETVSVADDGTFTAFTSSQMAEVTAYEWGRLYYASGWDVGQANIKVGVTHGYAVPPPDIREAALRYTQWLFSPGGATDRAIVLTDETGTYRLSVPNMSNRPTGIPEVDAALNRYREPVVA